VPSGGNLQAIEKSDFWKKSDFFALNKCTIDVQKNNFLTCQVLETWQVL